MPRDTRIGRPPEKVPQIDLCRQGGAMECALTRGLLPNFKLFSKVWGCLVVTRIGRPTEKVPRIDLCRQGGADRVSPHEGVASQLQNSFSSSLGMPRGTRIGRPLEKVP